MKWDKPTGSIQRTSDGCYLIERATTQPEWWIAYYLPAWRAAQKIAERESEEQARECCEKHAAQLGARIRA